MLKFCIFHILCKDQKPGKRLFKRNVVLNNIYNDLTLRQ